MVRVTRAIHLALALLLCASGAWAQSGADAAARHGLLVQAQAASDANNHDQALEFAQRAGRIQMTPSVRQFIAAEQAALGRYADALGNAQLCLHEAEADTAVRMRDAILQRCRELRTMIDPHVANLRVVVPTPVPSGLVVEVNGNVLHEAFWGVPYVVDVGDVDVSARAPGFNVFHDTLTIEAGATREVTVALVSNPSASPPPDSSSSPMVRGTSELRPASAAMQAQLLHPNRGWYIVPSAVMVVGVAGFLSAIVLDLAIRAPALNALNTACPNMMACPGTAENVANYNTALNGTIAVDVALGVGGVALAAGAIWLLARRPNDEVPLAMLRVTPTFGGAILGIGGTL